MRAASIPQGASLARPLSRRMLGLAGDERLVDQIRRGNEAAFEVAFERYGRGILGFCRHMLGSPEEAEDAVQHTFAAAYGDLQRNPEREIMLKPWLFAIARNRCLSVLRARREQVGEELELTTAGLAEEVERRAELRQLMADLQELPEEQRAALLLAELGDMPHAEIASVLDCEVSRVKALVFRARTALIQRREARDTSCEEIREQLANLRGGSLRRSELRLHLRECPGCQAYRHQVAVQRKMLAAALPVVPGLGLKASVLAAMGVGGGSAGGGAVAAGGLGGAGLASAGSFASATAVKVAMVAAIAGGGAVAGSSTLGPEERPDVLLPPAQAETATSGATAGSGLLGTSAAAVSAALPERARPQGTERAGADRSREPAADSAGPRAERPDGPKPGRPVKEEKAAGGPDRAPADVVPVAPSEPQAKPRPEPVRRSEVKPRPRPRETTLIEPAPVLEPEATAVEPSESEMEITD